VAHAYNPSYSGSKDQEYHGSKPAWANSSPETLSRKTLHKNRASGVAQGEGPEFKSQYRKKKSIDLKISINGDRGYSSV
jgi:hypothetical protein